MKPGSLIFVNPTQSQYTHQVYEAATNTADLSQRGAPLAQVVRDLDRLASSLGTAMRTNAVDRVRDDLGRRLGIDRYEEISGAFVKRISKHLFDVLADGEAFRVASTAASSPHVLGRVADIKEFMGRQRSGSVARQLLEQYLKCGQVELLFLLECLEKEDLMRIAALTTYTPDDFQEKLPVLRPFANLKDTVPPLLQQLVAAVGQKKLLDSSPRMTPLAVRSAGGGKALFGPGDRTNPPLPSRTPSLTRLPAALRGSPPAPSSPSPLRRTTSSVGQALGLPPSPQDKGPSYGLTGLLSAPAGFLDGDVEDTVPSGPPPPVRKGPVGS